MVHRIGYACELRLDTPEKLLGSVAVVLKQIVIHATMCHDTSLKRGTDVAFTFRGVAFRILLVTIFSCVGPRPFCIRYKPCPCGEERTNKNEIEKFWKRNPSSFRPNYLALLFLTPSIPRWPRVITVVSDSGFLGALPLDSSSAFPPRSGPLPRCTRSAPPNSDGFGVPAPPSAPSRRRPPPHAG